MKTLIGLIGLLFCLSLFAQEPKKEIYLTEIFERITQSDEEYEIINQHITSSNLNGRSLYNYLIENVGRENLEFDDEGRIMVKG